MSMLGQYWFPEVQVLRSSPKTPWTNMIAARLLVRLRIHGIVGVIVWAAAGTTAASVMKNERTAFLRKPARVDVVLEAVAD